jgi:cytochrome c-550 PedF
MPIHPAQAATASHPAPESQRQRKLLPVARRVSALTALSAVFALSASLGTGLVWAHGDVTPQAVDTSTLPKVGAEWRTENPFRLSEEAIKVGSAAYGQNCARCHGLDAVSGGIAPNLRAIDNDCVSLKDASKRDACVKENDGYYLTTVRHGRSRNGAVYMPPFEGTFDQEAMWAIKTYLESRREKSMQVAK